MLGFKSHLTSGKMSLSPTKLLDCFASGEARCVLLALEDRGEFQGSAGAQPQALRAPGRGCRQISPRMIIHVAENLLHSGKEE